MTLDRVDAEPPAKFSDEMRSWMNRFRLTGASPATALAAAERHLL